MHPAEAEIDIIFLEHAVGASEKTHSCLQRFVKGGAYFLNRMSP